jgi:hypothetical protein
MYLATKTALPSLPCSHKAKTSARRPSARPCGRTALDAIGFVASINAWKLAASAAHSPDHSHSLW